MKEKTIRECGVYLLLAALWLGLQAAPSSAQLGYRIDGEQVVIEGRANWSNWSIPANLAYVDSLGRIAPRSFKTVYNVLADTSF